MSRLPDLVHDTRLITSFIDNITIHNYDESDDENGARSTLRSEHWEQTSHLGHGSYGDVWLQQCVSGKRGYEQRAVKIIPRLRLKDKKDGYMAELEAIAKFSQRRYSKCFVKLLGWYDTDSSLYIAMEYVPLGDLEKYISDNGPMPEADVQQVSFQILEGLSYMHREGFAHRDIKPGNVLIKSQPPRRKWWVKISDFGISKRVETLKAQSTVKGTIQYMAPELIWHEAGNSINYMAADMWALGTMVYRMLTLMPVFATLSGYNYYLVNVDSFPLEELKERDASSDAVLFIRSLMGPRPGERLSSDKAMEHAWVASFKRQQTHIPTSPAPTSPAPTSSFSPDRYPISAANQSNPWATLSTHDTDFSTEAQQPRGAFTSSFSLDKFSFPTVYQSNPWATSSTPNINFSTEAQQPRGAPTSLAPTSLFSPDNYSISAADLSYPSTTLLTHPTREIRKMKTRKKDFSTEAQQSRDASAKYTLPTFAPQIPPEAASMLDKARGRQLEYDDTPTWVKRWDRRHQRQIKPLNTGLEANVISPTASVESLPAMPKTTTVLVTNIPATTADSDIRIFFSFFGAITDFEVATKDELKSALVTFQNEADVKTALFSNNTQIGPNAIQIVGFTSEQDEKRQDERKPE